MVGGVDRYIVLILILFKLKIVFSYEKQNIFFFRKFVYVMKYVDVWSFNVCNLV